MDQVAVKAGRAVNVCKKMLEAIPSSHRDAARDRKVAASRMKYDAAEIVRIARRVFVGEAQRVTIVGASGCGKTTGAALLIGELAKLVYRHFETNQTDPAGRDLSYWNWSTFWTSADDIAQAADALGFSDGYPELAKQAQCERIAIVDDLGNERGWKPNSNKLPPRIIQTRFEDAKKITIVTTGLTSAQILAAYGAGVERRLCDDKDSRLEVVGVFGGN